MSPQELLNINGNFDGNSLLMKTAHEMHQLLSSLKIDYVIIGGLAVIRNGAVRTTNDIDIIVGKEDWQKLKDNFNLDNYKLGLNVITNLENNISIDVLFKEDQWSIIPLPEPKEVAEYDEKLGANFIDLYHLIELKIATYLTKKRKEGMEIASKDLYDTVELIRNNDIKM